MISHINIKNFAIIENTEIEFNEGLNIVTGETGAGKSIVIEAVSLALGARADVSYIRTGCDKAVVQLVADLDGEDVIITREVSANGKNICKLNGEIVTLNELSKLCRKIADIHGQYDHQSLLNPDYHINLIDIYHSNKITPVKAVVADLFGEYRHVSSRLSELARNAAENAKKQDFMKFQLNEIRAANLVDGEDLALQEQIRILENSEKIYQGLAASYNDIYDGAPSVLTLLENTTKELNSLSDFSSDLNSISEQISDIYYNLEDLAREIRRQKDKIVFSQEELDDAISRYEIIEGLKRKYGNSISEILEFANKLEVSLDEVENTDKIKADLEKQLKEVTENLTVECDKLTALRKAAATELTAKIEAQLVDLNFNNAQLSIDFSEIKEFTENGKDNVMFLISTNKGEPLKPLSKIASGGEMSRIMLAFKKIVADYDGIPTLIFDEIDAGISGIAASVVGKKLKEISKGHQIICITHLPQIAACGNHNYKIEKSTIDEKTATVVSKLSDDQTVDEIARLLGGINITDTTIQSARELIAASK